MDFVDSLGTPFLAHRLRRLSDKMVDQVAANLDRAGLTVPARSVSTLYYLQQHGPTGPVALGKALKFSHPMMVRSLRNLEGLGLIEAVEDDSDQRRRRVRLTAMGKDEATRSMDVTHAFVAELDRLGRESGLDLATLENLLGGFARLVAELDIAPPQRDGAD